jgi:hypothetical protein
VKSARALLFGVTLLVAVPTSLAVFAPETAGRDVSVALFSARTVRSLTVTPVGMNAWIASCPRCVHRKLTQSLHLTAPTEIFAGGMLRVEDDRSGDTQTAAGLWHMRASRQSVDFQVVLTRHFPQRKPANYERSNCGGLFDRRQRDTRAEVLSGPRRLGMSNCRIRSADRRPNRMNT